MRHIKTTIKYLLCSRQTDEQQQQRGRVIAASGREEVEEGDRRR